MEREDEERVVDEGWSWQGGTDPGHHEHEQCADFLTNDDVMDTVAKTTLQCETRFVASPCVLEPAAWELVPRADTQTYLLAPKTSPPVV